MNLPINDRLAPARKSLTMNNQMNNQMILAEIHVKQALHRMRVGHQSNPLSDLVCAVEEAIAEARHRCLMLVSAGQVGTVEHLRLNEQIARWELARRRNR